MNHVLVSGANGFIGTRLCPLLKESNFNVTAAIRDQDSLNGSAGKDYAVVGEIGPKTHWKEALRNVDYVIHLAARVHVMKEMVGDPLTKYREVNTAGTVQLAKQAAEQGVKRFIYLSSIKVNGEKTNGHPFTADDLPSPQDPYGVSKAEAEEKLLEINACTSMEVVIVRPPLVYGAGVTGNFLRLMQVVERGVFLPLASIRNARSMITLENINDFILKCLEHPKAAGEIFLVSDGCDWSTPELIRCIACHMDVPAHLFPLPPSLFRLAGRVVSQLEKVNRLCDSLEVDIGKTRNFLEWVPPQLPDEGIKKAVQWYLGHMK